MPSGGAGPTALACAPVPGRPVCKHLRAPPPRAPSQQTPCHVQAELKELKGEPQVEELQQLALGDVALEDFAKVLYLGHAAQRGRRAHAAPRARAPQPRAAPPH